MENGLWSTSCQENLAEPSLPAQMPLRLHAANAKYITLLDWGLALLATSLRREIAIKHEYLQASLATERVASIIKPT